MILGLSLDIGAQYEYQPLATKIYCFKITQIFKHLVPFMCPLWFLIFPHGMPMRFSMALAPAAHAGDAAPLC